MNVKADAERVLMSDVLKGTVPELEAAAADPVGEMEARAVTVVLELFASSGNAGIVGVLRGIVVGPDPQVELRVPISDALTAVEGAANGCPWRVVTIQLHQGERVV